MKSIVVPVDFSNQSEIALRVAAKIATKNDSELYVLHMLELSPAIMAETGYVSQEHVVHLIKTNEERFAHFLDKPYLRNLKIIPVIKHYKVFSEVDEVAKMHEADLVVMGSHGTDGLQEIFIGSNTERVVRNSDIPVLVVKGEVKDFEPKKMVFASDFKEESISALKDAVEFAKAIGTSLMMVYINTSGDSFLSTEDAHKKISKALHQAKLGMQVTIYNDYTVERGILNYAESEGADLIGIPTHGRKGLAHFFRGSIGEDIANHSMIPVVTFKI